MSIRTPLAKVKHLGSARSGTHHFVHQRVSAVFMILLLSWFIITALNFILVPLKDIPQIIASPVNIVASILFIGMFLYHGSLGMRVIIEDYVHCKAIQNLMLMGLYFLSIITFIAGVVAVFIIHFIFKTL